jgi:hypothetical protein
MRRDGGGEEVIDTTNGLISFTASLIFSITVSFSGTNGYSLQYKIN